MRCALSFVRIAANKLHGVHPMAHKNTVYQSINLNGENICVDIFQRPDGTYGYDEFRRDFEDPRGWYSIGHFGDQVFDDADQALTNAKNSIQWLSDQLQSSVHIDV
jgi:hypothetical protein